MSINPLFTNYYPSLNFGDHFPKEFKFLADHFFKTLIVGNFLTDKTFEDLLDRFPLDILNTKEVNIHDTPFTIKSREDLKHYLTFDNRLEKFNSGVSFFFPNGIIFYDSRQMVLPTKVTRFLYYFLNCGNQEEVITFLQLLANQNMKLCSYPTTPMYRDEIYPTRVLDPLIGIINLKAKSINHQIANSNLNNREMSNPLTPRDLLFGNANNEVESASINFSTQENDSIVVLAKTILDWMKCPKEDIGKFYTSKKDFFDSFPGLKYFTDRVLRQSNFR